MAEVSTTAHTAEVGHEAPEAKALGLDAGGWVALAMLVVFAVMIWKRVPAMIGKALDSKIASIRAQLDEAKTLRAEAEALKAEYEAKSAAAGDDAAAMVERAKVEAESILAKARHDAEQLVERRTAMAEAKIAAEERAAVDQVRAAAVTAATAAATKLIAERSDANSDKALVDQAIAGL